MVYHHSYVSVHHLANLTSFWHGSWVCQLMLTAAELCAALSCF